MPLHVSSTVVLIIRGSKLYYTVSHSVGGRPVCGLREDWLECQPAHRTATYRCDDTTCCIIQFSPPDDEHTLLETCTGI